MFRQFIYERSGMMEQPVAAVAMVATPVRPVRPLVSGIGRNMIARVDGAPRGCGSCGKRVA